MNGNKVEPCMRPRLASISKTPWEAWAAMPCVVRGTTANAHVE